MARKSSTATASASAAPAPAAVAPVVTMTVTPVVEEPKAKVSRKPKAAAAPAPAAVAQAPVVEAPVVEVATAPAAQEEPAATEVASLQSKLADFGSKIQQIGALHSSLKTEYKVLEKTIAREIKQIVKASGLRRRSSGSKKHSGFLKPSHISEELLKFLNKEAGTMMSRVDVSNAMNEYITTNNLQNPSNGRIILADAKLSKLLNISAGEELTYFNLQKYMKHHFIKATPVATA